LFQEYQEFFDVLWHTDDSGNKISIQRLNEQHKIVNGKIILNGIPNSFYKVTISNKYEVNSIEQIIDNSFFKVYYLTGEVFFHSSLEGQTIIIAQYYDRGLIKLYGKRVELQNIDNLYNATNIEDFATDITNRVNNIVSSAGDSNTEIVDSRNNSLTEETFVTLKDRLDSENNEFIVHTTKYSSLAEIGHVQLYNGIDSTSITEAATANAVKIVNDKASNPQNYIADNVISSIKLKQTTDADKIQLANLSLEVRDAIAGTTTIGTTPAPGSVTATELANGAVDNSKIADNTITVSKIADQTLVGDFIIGKNIFNKNTAILGYYVSYINGTLISGEAPAGVPQSASDYIPIKQNTNYKANYGTYIAFYDVSKIFISGISGSTTSGLYLSPANAYFIRVSVRQEYLDTYQLEEGDTITTYEPYSYSLEKLKVDSSNLNDNSVLPDNLSSVSLIKSKNLFNPENITVDYYVDGLTGILKNDLVNQNATEYINVKPNISYTASRTTYYAIYDINEVYIQGANNSSSSPFTIVIPPNGVYIRLSIRDDYITTYQFEEGESATSYVSYADPYYKLNDLKLEYNNLLNTPSIVSPWTGNTMNIIGDSITYGLVNYPEIGDVVLNRFSNIVAEELNMTLNNYGINSSTISVKATDPTGRDPIVTRYTSMSNSADLIIVAGGTNDWMYDWTPLGDMNSRSNNEFYGALHNLCLGLLDKYIGKQLLFMTPIKRYQAPYNSPTAINANGKTLREYCDIIKEVCSYYGIPVLDMHSECTLNPFIVTQQTVFFPDGGTHPNDAGHVIMANRLIGCLKQLR